MKNNNAQNIHFYENIDVDYFKQMAVKGGFDKGRDMEVAKPFYINTQSLLEIGAGYGRCINYLLNNNYKGKIIAVEYSKALVSYLKNTFKEKIEILNSDINNLSIDLKVDVAIWMWSGFIDFTVEEQKKAILRVFDLLNQEGKLIIDIPQIGVQTIAQHKDAQNIHFDTEYGSLDCYIPNFDNMQAYADFANFKTLDLIDYHTDTGKERSLYIFCK